MPAFTFVAPLRTLTKELTSVAPHRTLPDWTVGDPIHRAGVSDHNIDDTPGWRTEQTDADNIPEVRAVDIRLPLRAPFTAEQFVQWLIKQARAGKLPWLRYVIFKARIWTRTGGWVAQKYYGINPHNEHIHVSSLASKDNDTTSARLSGLLPATSQEDDMSVEDVIKGLNTVVPYAANPGRRLQAEGWNDVSSRTILEYVWETARATNKAVADIATILASREDVDEVALAEALAPAVAAAVLSAIPEDRDDVTVEELTEAFRRAVSGPAPTPAEPPAA